MKLGMCARLEAQIQFFPAQAKSLLLAAIEDASESAHQEPQSPRNGQSRIMPTIAKVNVV
jgi:hypothetical protein